MKDMQDFYEGYWKYRKETNHLYSSRTPKRITKTIEILSEYEVSKILDIGCGEGTLGQMLNDEYQIIGVDISDQALQLANDHYDGTRQLNIEEDSLSTIMDDEFDAVVCLELLEHVFKPEKVLRNIRSVLRSDGLFIPSFPNFVFWEHRLDMIRGRPPRNYTLYSEAEHIQDFTIGTFEKLLKNSGFKVEEWHPQYPLPKFIPSFFGRIRPSLFANQVVIESKMIPD